MGHTHCGAVETTVRSLTHDDTPEASRNVRSIVDRIAPHLEDLCRTPMDHARRMTEAVRVNAVASAHEVPTTSELLQGLVASGRVRIVPAVLDLATGVVSFHED